MNTLGSLGKGLRDVDGAAQSNTNPLCTIESAALGRDSLRGVSQFSTKAAGEVTVSIGIRVRLGGTVDITQPFPERPQGIHFLTYMKHAMRARRAEAQANAELIEWVDSIQRRPVT